MTEPLDPPTLGVLVTNLDGGVLEANDTLLDTIGYTRNDLERGDINWKALTPPEWGDATAKALEQLATDGIAPPFEKEFQRKDGSRVPVLVWSTRVPNKQENHTLVLDIGAQKNAQERLRLLADASAILSSSLDYQKTVEALAKLVVPALGDWCAVDIVSEVENVGGPSGEASSPRPLDLNQVQLLRLAAQHQDPLKLDLARRLYEAYPPDLSSPHGLGYVLKTGRSEWMADIPAELLASSARDEEHRTILEALGLRSFIIVPLHAAGRVFGALTLVYAESGRRYTESDVRFAEEVASRAAAAVEHARLFRQAQRARREVEAQKAIFDLIVNQSGDGIIMADATGTIRVFNPAAASQHGATKQEVAATEWTDAYGLLTLDGAPLPLEETPLFRAVRGESVAGARWQIRRADGSLRTLSGTASPLRQADGTPAGGVLICRDETEQLKLQEALESQAKLTRAITDNATAGLVLLDARQHCTYLNPAAEKMFGYSLAEVLALDAPLHTIVHPAHTDEQSHPNEQCHAEPRPLLVQALASAIQFKGEDVFTRRDGTSYPVTFAVTPMNTKGRVTGAVLEVRDVSEEKRREHERERLFHSIVENLPELAWSARRDGFIDYYNSRWYEYTGTDFEAMQGWGWQSVHDPHFLTQVTAHWKHCLATGEPFEMEYPLKGADGVFRWFITRVRPLRDDTGQIVRWFGQNTNIDEQKQVQALQERQARHALLMGEVGAALTQSRSIGESLNRCTASLVEHLDAAFARIWTVDARNEVLELQSSAGLYTHIDGAHARVPIGQFKIGRIAQKAQPHLSNDVQNDPLISNPAWVRAQGMVAFAGYPLRIDDRVIGVMALFSKRPLTDDTLAALASIADSIAMGIERRRAEQRAHEKREALEIINHVGRSLAAELDSEKLIQSLTDAATRLAGAELGIFDRGFAKHHSIRVDDVTEQPELVLAASLLAKQTALSSFLAVPVTSRSGAVLGGLLCGHSKPGAFNERHEMLIAGVAAQAAVALDNAHLFQKADGLIKSLERSNKELEQFAYVASHDLKAPLRGIANLSSWLEEDLDEVLTDDSRQQMNLLRGRVHRLESLINGILSYSRAGRVREKPESVDVAKLVEETVELLAPPPEATVRMHDDLPTLTTARAPLQQVFLNLISNALKHAQRRDVVVEVGAQEGDEVWEFFVRDNGPGIAAQFQERVWGIFQTLAARDKVEGTGVGLSVVRKIAEAKGGRAWLDSNTEAGATFRFTWPKREPSPVENMERADE